MALFTEYFDLTTMDMGQVIHGDGTTETQALGLDRDTATLLTLETAYGAARMAREGDEPPGRLRANVTSPGGTTERALSILDDGGVRQALNDAIAGAAQRARELAKDNGQS